MAVVDIVKASSFSQVSESSLQPGYFPLDERGTAADVAE